MITSFRWLVRMIFFNGIGNQELKDKDHKWNEIEDDTSIEAAHEPVGEATALMESGSIGELYLWSLVFNLQLSRKHFIKIIIVMLRLKEYFG